MPSRTNTWWYWLSGKESEIWTQKFIKPAIFLSSHLAKYNIILAEQVSELGLFKNYVFLPFVLLWKHRHWESPQNTVSSAWDHVCDQDWVLPCHLLWHTGRQTKICTGRCWKSSSPTVLQFSKALWRLLSVVPPKFEFESQRGCMGPSCPMVDITLPLTCFWAVHGGLLGWRFISRDSRTKLKWPRSNQARSWSLTRKKKSLVFGVLWHKNPYWVYQFISVSVDSHLWLPISTQIYKSKEIPTAQAGLSTHRNKTGHTASVYKRRLLFNLSWVKQRRLYHRLLAMQWTRNTSSGVR